MKEAIFPTFRLFTENTNESAYPLLLDLPKKDNFSLSDAETIISGMFPREDLKSCLIHGGLNNSITGGALFRFDHLVAKLTPNFQTEQDTLAKTLREKGHYELSVILKKYPNNHIGAREIESYNFLSKQEFLQVPKIYFGYLSKDNGPALLVTEYLTNYKPLNQVEPEVLLKPALNTVIHDLALFHSNFYKNIKQISKLDWLGNWWQDKNSDYLARNVARYSLSACSRFIKTKDVSEILEMALAKRERIWDIYNNYKFNTFIHWDLSPTNVFVDISNKKNGSSDFKVIDWQTSSIGVPQWDLAQILIPLLGKLNESDINQYIDKYYDVFASTLDQNELKYFDKNQFKTIFNIIVADHSFRTSINVLLSNDTENTEWEKCLKWLDLNKDELKLTLKAI